MAKTKQFTISVDNQPGAVARIAKALGDSKVNILALLGTAQGTTGSIQLVAEDAKKIGRASCRERVWIWVAGGRLKEKSARPASRLARHPTRSILRWARWTVALPIAIMR